MHSDRELLWHLDLSFPPQVADRSPQDLEEALCRTRAALEGYRSLYENTPSVYFVLDLQGNILGINGYGADRLGYAVADLIQQPIFSTFHAEDRSALEAAFLAFVQTAPAVTTVDKAASNDSGWEFRQVCRDGSVIWSRMSLRILPHPSAVLFVCEDVTQRRQAEAQLHLLEQVIAGSSSSVVIVDATLPEQPIVFVNHSFERLTGYRAADVQGHNCRFLQGNNTDQPALAELRSALQAGKPCQVVLQNYRKDNTLFWNELHISPIFSTAGQLTHFVGVQTDVTERKRQEAIVQQQAEQERRIAALTQLSAGIAQRIRRSLNLDEILKTTVTEIRQFLATDRVFIYRFHPDWGGVVAVESVEANWKSIQGKKIRDSFFGTPAGRDAYKRGRMQIVGNVRNAGLSACHLDLMNQLQVRASLVLPILQSSGSEADDQLWGLLVAHHCASPREWQPLETDSLSQLASQVGIAIQQAELYQQVQRLNAQLEQQVQARTEQLQRSLTFEALLKRITDRVRDTLDERQILQSAVRELNLGLGVDSCDTAVYELEPLPQTALAASQVSKIATIRYEHHRSGIPSTPQRSLHMSESPELYDQLLQGQYTQFCRLRARQGWRSVLACPIFDDQGTLGDLWLYRPKEQPFDELEIRLVQQVANQCAIALRQARFHQAIQTQLVELEKLNQLKDDFLSTISHELRSPVCNMKMAIQMLEVSRPDSNQAIEPHRSSRYLNILKNECDREINLIDDLLDLQKLESNGRLISPAAIELPLWFTHLVKPFQERAQARQQRLELHLSSNLPILISDPSRLDRILHELLSNACKYTPSGERIVVAAQAQTQTVRLSVCSLGVEISSEEQAHVFDQFYRIPRTNRAQQGGSGLGLALVKKLTQLLGGRVYVESASNQTCFFVELPINYLAGDLV